jgi:hypothetical protein
MSQIYKTSSGGSGGVTSITGTDGIIVSPTIGNSVVSLAEPTAFLNEFDDFISSGKSKLNWSTISGTGGIIFMNGIATNPGILQLASQFTNNNSGLFIGQTDAVGNPVISPIALGSGELICNWIIQLTALSGGGNTYIFSCGLADTTTLGNGTDTFVDGIYFQYTDTINSGNWTINSTSSSVTTTANTSTTVTTDFVTLSMMVNAAGTSVSYFVNGIQVSGSPLTTNIPTAALTPFFVAINTAGNTPTFNADLFSVRISLSRPGLTM